MKKFSTCFILAVSILMLSCTEDTVDIERKGSISGTVTDQDTGLPIENVKITTNPVSNSALTDDQGEFLIENVLIDDYSVQAENDNYVTTFEPITVLENEIAVVIIEMTESNSAVDPPIQPILLTPEDNAQDVPQDVEFIWSSASNNSEDLTYSLELRNGETNELTHIESIVDTTYTIENLTLGVNYFWQITADDTVNEPVTSTISSFSTKDPSVNRFFYVRKEGNNNVIYSGTDQDGDATTTNENEIQLTSSTTNSFRPRMNQTANKIAFLRTVGANTQLFAMNLDGTELDQLTNSIPVVGFRQDEVDFTWYQNGQRLYYPNLNKLYSVNAFGNGNSLVYEAPPGVLITEVDVNEANNIIAIKTNDASGYSARIVVINPNSGIEQAVIVENLPGALGGIDYSIDGTKVLYTRDVSGFENANYRQLDTRIFVHDITSNMTEEIDTEKPPGTNDLDCKYSPDEGAILFMNTSSDGVSEMNIYRINVENTNLPELLFTDASMPDWE